MLLKFRIFRSPACLVKPREEISRSTSEVEFLVVEVSEFRVRFPAVSSD